MHHSTSFFTNITPTSTRKCSAGNCSSSLDSTSPPLSIIHTPFTRYCVIVSQVCNPPCPMCIISNPTHHPSEGTSSRSFKSVFYSRDDEVSHAKLLQAPKNTCTRENNLANSSRSTNFTVAIQQDFPIDRKILYRLGILAGLGSTTCPTTLVVYARMCPCRLGCVPPSSPRQRGGMDV